MITLIQLRIGFPGAELWGTSGFVEGDGRYDPEELAWCCGYPIGLHTYLQPRPGAGECPDEWYARMVYGR